MNRVEINKLCSLNRTLPPVYIREPLSSKIERMRDNLQDFQEANSDLLKKLYAKDDVILKVVNENNFLIRENLKLRRKLEDK